MRISHVGLTVENLADAITFYEGSFGFEVFHKVTRDEPWIGTVVGVRGARLHFAHLRLGGTHLELIEYAAPTPIEHMVTALPWRIGMQHFCLEVEHLAATLRRAEERGGIRWSTDVATIPDGPNMGARVVYLRGPSGELIELFEKASA